MSVINEAAVYRIILITATLAFLFFAGLLIVRPFIPSILLALIFAVAVWPLFLRMRDRLKIRVGFAAAIMTLGLALFFIVPFTFLANNLAGNFIQLSDTLVKFFHTKHDNPPEWVTGLPVVGGYVAKYWADYISNTTYLAQTLQDNMETVSQLVLKVGSTIGGGIVDLALGVFFTFFLFFHGKELLHGVETLLNRFLGDRAKRLLLVSRTTIVGIVYGLLGTALAQAVVAGIGFAIAGVPGAVFLALLVFILSAVPVGPPLIWVPAAMWLFSEGETGMGLFMLVYGLLAISAIDNVLRPYLISQGSRMPFLVVLLGALGGIFTFGFIGFFIGPTVLAVIYILLKEETRTRKGKQPA